MDKYSKPEFHRSFFGPRYWPTWILLAFFKICARLPVAFNIAIGRFIGFLFTHLAPSRWRVASANIAGCFPDLAKEEQEKIVRGVMRSCGIGIMESAMALWGQADKLRDRHTIEGLEHIAAVQASGRGVLLVGSHLTTLDAAGRIVSGYIKMDILYRKDPNPLLAYALVKAREQYLSSAIVRNGSRQLIRNLRAGGVVWYAPDQDYGIKQSVFAPFFGIQAATVTTARIAQLGEAAVLPFSHYRNDDGCYRVVIGAELTDFPSGDAVADATRTNKIIEDMIRAAPDQYLWVHRRFKTRPPGEASFYKKKQ